MQTAPSTTAGSYATCAVLALLQTHCGALGAPAHGDRDLPASLFSGYALINNGTSPTASPALITADGNVSISDPTVATVNGTRVIFLSHRSQDGRSRIARSPEHTRDLLDFSTVTPVFEATQAWEGSDVASPSLVTEATTNKFAMFYEANGAIGVARSTDTLTWDHGAAPVLSASAERGEMGSLHAPSVAVDTTQTYWMAYENQGAISIAIAPAVDGPWRRIGNGPIATAAGITVTVGTVTAPATALSDPALTISTTAAGRTLWVLSASVRSAARIPAIVVGWGSVDGIHFTRAERPLFVDRGGSIRPGAFEVIDSRTTLLWVARETGGTTVVGALLSPPGQRIGTQLMR